MTRAADSSPGTPTPSDVGFAGTAGTAGTKSHPSAREFRVLNGGSDERESLPAVPAVPALAADQRRVTGDPVAWFEELLAAAGSARVGGKWQCPAHGLAGEHSTSLRLARGHGGRALLFCHGGCDWRDVLRALMLSPDTLWTQPATSPARHARFYLRRMKFPAPKLAGNGGTRAKRGFRFEAEHPYAAWDDVRTPIAWKLRYRHPGTGAKEVFWESLNPRGERVPGLLGRPQADLALYLQHDLAPALAAGERIVLVESESSVDALVRAGLYATTWCGGAADPPLRQLVHVLGGHADVLIVPDNDDAGRRAGDAVAAALPRARTRLGEPGEDARDLLTRLGPAGF